MKSLRKILIGIVSISFIIYECEAGINRRYVQPSERGEEIYDDEGSDVVRRATGDSSPLFPKFPGDYDEEGEEFVEEGVTEYPYIVPTEAPPTQPKEGEGSNSEEDRGQPPPKAVPWYKKVGKYVKNKYSDLKEKARKLWWRDARDGHMNNYSEGSEDEAESL